MKVSPSRVMLGIVVLSICIRLVVVILLGDSALPISGAYDQVSYDMLAQRVVAGKGFSFPTMWYPFTAPDEQTAHWSFLYTLYLAGVYALFGHHPLAARLIQVLFSGLQCWLIYRIGRRLASSLVGDGQRSPKRSGGEEMQGVGVAAAALTALYAYFIFFNAALMTQTYYILALLLSLELATSLAVDSESETRNLKSEISRWIILGFALGVAALMRQTILLFAPILFTYIWWSRRQRYGDTLLRAPALLVSLFPFLIPLAIIAALILPWTIRNYLVYDDFLLLNSNGGFWLYSSNHPDQGTQFNGNYVAPIPDDLKGLGEPAIDRALTREGIDFILADPARFLLLTWSRVGAYFWVSPTEGSLLIANLSRLVSFGLYFPFMLYGLWLSRKRWRVCLPLYLYVAFETTFCLFSWAAPRYRLPSDAIMMAFAGLAVVALLQRVGIAQTLVAKFQIINHKS